MKMVDAAVMLRDGTGLAMRREPWVNWLWLNERTRMLQLRIGSKGYDWTPLSVDIGDDWIVYDGKGQVT